MVLVFYEKKTIIVSMKAMNNKKNVEHDFSKGSMIRNILSMAVPVTIAQAVQLLYNLVDRVYLGHIGQGADQALTGVGLDYIDRECIYAALFRRWSTTDVYRKRCRRGGKGIKA